MFYRKLVANYKQIMMLLADLIWLPLALWLSVVISHGNLPISFKMSEFTVFSMTTILTLIAFLRLGLYRSVIRFMGIEAIFAVVKGVSISVILLTFFLLIFPDTKLLYSGTIIYWSLALFFVGGSRFIIWRYYQYLFRQGCEKVAIYGAGDAGRQLLMALQQGDEYQTVAFIDDSPKLNKRIINGVVVSSSKHLDELIAQKGIQQILIAIPSLSISQRKNIIAKLEHLPVHVKKIPVLADIVSGKSKIEELREVEIEDLLARDIVVPNERLFEQCIKNKTVMVTGAGGSIGSELCRQIIKYHPKQLVLFEISEIALYSIEQELQQLVSQQLPIIALLGSVQNEAHLMKICNIYPIDTIYHSAAYKHVPIVEENIVEGIRNNVFGTQSIANVAQVNGVETVVLISTDKAVRPTNIMGASKRFAEMILQSQAKKGNQHNKTRYCMVRFGNVLGSSGSVVPLFQQQIRDGGPVTVTHPDIERYFMTIPEAAQLVIQASALGSEKNSSGNVYVLDMGEPVKVIDLAKRMIHLSGYEVKDDKNPHGDIEITYSGLRPGEKLFEELLIGNNVFGTEHPRIMRAEEKMLEPELLNEKLVQLERACSEYELEKITGILVDSDTAYQPESKKIVDFLLQENSDNKKEHNIYQLNRSS